LLPLGGLGSATVPWASLAGIHLVQKGYVPSGFDPEFELLAVPNYTYLGRIFYLSTVADPSTHMFEAKAEVLGWVPPAVPPPGQQPAGKVELEDPALDQDLRPGLTAKIRFPMRSNPNAVVVPEEAVRASERGWIAFV